MKNIELCQALENAYYLLNQYLTGGSLPEEIVLLIAPVGRRKKYGHFHGKSWETKDGETKHEILIAGEYLIERSALGVLETLVHEMVHLANHINDIKDCTVTQYHNRKFKEKAQEFKLTVSKMGNKGWASTDLTDELKQWLIDNGLVAKLEPLLDCRKLNLGKSADTTKHRFNISLKDDDWELEHIVLQFAKKYNCKKSQIVTAFIEYAQDNNIVLDI